MASTFEIGCSILLILGLGTRLATLPLLGMIAVIQTFVYPARLRRAPDVGVDPALPAHARRPAPGRSTASSVWSRRISRPADVGEQRRRRGRRCPPGGAWPCAWRSPSPLLTFLSVAIVGVLVRERQKRELEDAVGTQLLNIARVAVLLVDPAQHAELERAPSADSGAYRRMRTALAAVQREVLLTTPIRTLVEFDRAGRRARIVVTSERGRAAGRLVRAGPRADRPDHLESRGRCRALHGRLSHRRRAPGSARWPRSSTVRVGRSRC